MNRSSAVIIDLQAVRLERQRLRRREELAEARRRNLLHLAYTPNPYRRHLPLGFSGPARFHAVGYSLAVAGYPGWRGH